MLYGLGPGDLLVCLVPFFLVLMVMFGLLLRTDQEARDAEDDDNE